MEISFQNKVVLITGATGQLGRVMVRNFAENGADVVIHYYRNEEKALSLKKEVEAFGQKAMVARADIAGWEDIKKMKENVISEFESPHIIVNNAVIQYEWTNVLEQDSGDFISQFESCVMHNVYMAKEFIPEMIKRKSGRFIGINTECSMLCNADSAAYASAKRGMDGIYRTLAKEVGMHNITVNQVAPGWTISEKDRLEGTQRSPEYEKATPLSRRGTDQEIANAVLFLASDLSSNITGVYLPVCGGRCMPGI